MNKAFNKVIKNHLFLTVLSVVAVILMTTGISYSLFSTEHENTEDQSISIGTLSAQLTSSGPIVLSDIHPQSDEDGMNNQGFTFTVNNNGTYPLNYEIYLADSTPSIWDEEYDEYDNLSCVDFQYIKVGFESNHDTYIVKTLDGYFQDDEVAGCLGSTVLYHDELPIGSSQSKTIHFWLDENAPNEVEGSVLALSVHLRATTGDMESPASKTLMKLGYTASDASLVDYAVNAPGPTGYKDLGISDEVYSLTIGPEYSESKFIPHSIKYYFNTSRNYYYLNAPASGVFRDVYIMIRSDYISSVDIANLTDYEVNEATNLPVIYKVLETTYDEETKIGTMTYSPSLGSVTVLGDETQNGIFPMYDDDGVSYYFRGNVENNYIGFAGNSWRILRINGDGSLRLILSEPLNTMTFGNTVDYSNSTIKTYLDTWFENAINSFFGDEHAHSFGTSYFCNDKTFKNQNNLTLYSAQDRLVTKKYPSLTCINSNDKMKYNIGLPTADEVALAGGLWNSPNDQYYLSGSAFWTMTPYSSDGPSMFVGGSLLSSKKVSESAGIVPIITISADVVLDNITGSGTKNNPFYLDF